MLSQQGVRSQDDPGETPRNDCGRGHEREGARDTAESAFGGELPTQAGRREPDHTFNRKRDRSGGEPHASEQHTVDRAERLIAITQGCHYKAFLLARPEGFEPPTHRSVVWCSN